jgi:hypothetical protein
MLLHMEDRRRLLDHKKQPLALQPIDTATIQAPGGGIAIVEGLYGDIYSSTGSDGALHAVEITTGTIEVAQQEVQAAIDSLQWFDQAASSSN